MKDQDKFNEDFYFDIIEDFNDTLYKWVDKKVDLKVKQAKQEKAKEIKEDFERQIKNHFPFENFPSKESNWEEFWKKHLEG